jgi:hypothetical protein
MKKIVTLLILLFLITVCFASNRLVQIGSTDVTLQIPLYDATNGSLKTGVTIANLDVYYIRVETDEDVTLTGKVDATALANLTADHTENYAYEIGQGYYRFDFNDSLFAAGATTVSVIITDGTGATILPVTIDFQLVDYNPYATVTGIYDIVANPVFQRSAP